MSKVAEMKIENLFCEKCGVLIDKDSPGLPRTCATCDDDKAFFESSGWMRKVEIDNKEEVAYVQMRVKSDETITAYFEEKDGNLSQLDDFVKYVIAFRTSLLEETNDMVIDIYSPNEVAYIAQKKGVPADIVEIVYWFEECYHMSLGNVTLVEACKKCKQVELLIKEDEETLFATYLECKLCKERYDYEDFD